MVLLAIEKNFKSFKKDIQKAKGLRDEGVIYSFDEALEIVQDGTGELMQKEIDTEMKYKSGKLLEGESKTKEHLRELKEEKRVQISNVVFSKNIRVRDYSPDEFIDAAVEELVGYSILSEADKDPSITDIYCIEWNKIYVEKNGKNEKYPYTFRSKKHYHNFIERVLRDGGNGVGKVVDSGEHKLVDAEFYGDRVQVTSESVTPKDKTLTIRKHSENHVKVSDLLQQGVLNDKIYDFLSKIILGELNLIYAGITGSGKTTSIRAILDDTVTKSNKRMLVCEDTQELAPENDHTVEMVSSKNPDPRLEVTLYDIIMATLRLKPKYIVVGEVRGKEAQAAVEAMETGHSTIFTMHGGEPINIINRLVTKYLMAMPNLGIDVVERIIGSAVDYIAIQDDIPKIGRRISIISEVSYDFEKRRVMLKPIWEFDFKTKAYKMVNKISPTKAKTMMRRGLDYEDIKDIVDWEAEV